jgi:hypothetical protein
MKVKLATLVRKAKKFWKNGVTVHDAVAAAFRTSHVHSEYNFGVVCRKLEDSRLKKARRIKPKALQLLLFR